MIRDKAGKAHWDSVWQEPPRVPSELIPGGLRGHIRRTHHRYFQRLFNGIETRRLHLLEIGCARSFWLPYFAREFGFEVHGLDYSEIGCRQAAAMLERYSVRGETTCADAFSPPEPLVGAFDVVTSFGVVEHFENTAGCLRAFSRFLKPGGMLITLIPNMAGLAGALQKLICRRVFDMHVPMSSERLGKSHQDAGLSVIECGYLVFNHFGVCNAGSRQSPLWSVKQAALGLLTGVSAGFWLAESLGIPLKPNRWTSAYVCCSARAARQPPQ